MIRRGMRWVAVSAATLAVLALSSCSQMDAKKGGNALQVTSRIFGKTADGHEVMLYSLTNANGMQVDITNFGGTVVRLMVPDGKGNIDDVVLGYDSLEGYVNDTNYFGCLIGRYGNRIEKGHFVLDGSACQLTINNDGNHLHGGKVGFDKALWGGESFEKSDGVGLELTHVSPDGDQGYPGTLTAVVTYSLNNDNELKIHYKATTDQPTIVNLTNHSYFNLAGAGNGTILDHQVRIFADHSTPIDASIIPTGEIEPVAGTPLDFTEPVAIGARINADYNQIKWGNGYDLNYVLNKPQGKMGLAARVEEPTSGRAMEVYTTEPGLQFYSGNFLDGSAKGKNGKTYPFRGGFCMETQHYPDSPNKPGFPSTVLRPGETYETTTVYRFCCAACK